MSRQNREAVRERLEAIASRNAGRLSPDDAIADARDEDSPLHEHFTWDDTEAAHKQRLYEARELIRAVRVQATTNETVREIIAYVRDPTKPSGEAGYISTAVLRTDEDLARAALVDEFSRAAAAMRRALAVADALSLRPDVAAQLQALESLRERVESRI